MSGGVLVGGGVVVVFGEKVCFRLGREMVVVGLVWCVGGVVNQN